MWKRFRMVYMEFQNVPLLLLYCPEILYDNAYDLYFRLDKLLSSAKIAFDPSILMENISVWLKTVKY